MKTFEVGQRVWMDGAGGMREGTVTFINPKGGMWVTWCDGQRGCYRKDERNALLTDGEAEVVREKRRVARDFRLARDEYDSAVRALTRALDGGRVPGGHAAETVRRVTTVLIELERDINGGQREST